MSKVRKASHAGSWYKEEGDELSQQLGEWLSHAQPSMRPARAIIAPHAGYYYCGACGGHAYKQIDPSTVKRVFILGPSHHVRLSGCALSRVERYQTPLYDLNLDQYIYRELHDTGMFTEMSLSTDEGEHSIEMHLPYIAKVMHKYRDSFTIIPILVGSLSTDRERAYGQLLAPYLSDPNNLFIISSDFCHWGERFRYTYHDKSCGQVWQSIENLDRAGMQLIENMDPEGFSEYLAQYQNTICGRHPIAVLLNAISVLRSENGHHFSLKFVQYAQSSKCKSTRDSSVSYASAALTITN